MLSLEMMVMTSSVTIILPAIISKLGYLLAENLALAPVSACGKPVRYRHVEHGNRHAESIGIATAAAATPCRYRPSETLYLLIEKSNKLLSQRLDRLFFW